MCGRFALTLTPEELQAVYALLDVEPFPPRYNIAPTQPILTVTAGWQREPGSNLPDRRTLLARWGLIPAWAKEPKKLPLLCNARSETAATNGFFKAALRHRRALVPASGFYEWKKQANGKTGQAFWVRPRHGHSVAFGALLETYLDPNGSEIDTVAILTTAANEDVAAIHERMPVVIKPEDFARWLDCRTQEPQDVADLMQSPLPGLLEAVPVSDKVNKVANVGPELIERVETAPEEREPAPAEQLTLL